MVKEPKFYELKEGLEYFSANKKKTDEVLKNEKLKKLPLLNRLQHSNKNSYNNDDAMIFRSDSFGNKQMTFTSKKVNLKFFFQIDKLNLFQDKNTFK